MRIITGTARGRNLKTLDGLDVRPTASSVKEAIFSAVQFETAGAVAADLFAGSGQLGIEAVSRGASKCYFSDINSAAIGIIRENAEHADMTAKIVLRCCPAQAMLKSIAEPIDIALLDPPYGRGHIEKTLPKLIPQMSEKGVIICEHENELTLPEIDGFRAKRHRYGKTAVTLYRRKPEDPEDI